MKVLPAERELHIGGYTYKQDSSKSNSLEVYTNDFAVMAKLDKYCFENPDEWRIKETILCQGDIVGKRYICSFGCVLLRGKPRKGIQQTEEQKQKARERMIGLRKAGIL